MTSNSPRRRINLIARCLALATTILLALQTSSSQAAHAPAPKLLPANTLAFAHVSSVPDLVDGFNQTNLGRMVNDPQIKPFFANLFDAAQEALARFRESSGLSLEELFRIPQGEITVALVPTDATDTNPASAALIVLIDCGDNIASGRKLIDALAKMFERAGGPGQEENVGDMKLRIFANARRAGRQLALFEHDNTVALVTGLQVVANSKLLIDHWNTGVDDCLANNGQFNTIMARCRSTKDEPPQITFYADPIATFDQLAKETPALQGFQSFLPTLGLNGLRGIGGSLVLATEDFDSIAQFHALLDNPRSGLLDLVAFTSGDNTPPAWVPADLANSSSFHWNFERAFREGTKLLSQIPFLGTQAGAEWVNGRVESFLGVDLEHDLLPAATGRVLQLHWFENPPRIGRGACQCGALQLKDPKAFASTLDRIVDHFGAQIEKKGVAGISYYKQAGERDAEDVRREPCFAMLNDWLLISDSPEMLEHLLKRRNDTTEGLADALDFKLVANKIARQPGGAKAGMLGFGRQEDSWKYLYDLAASDKTRETLRKRGETNRFSKALNQGLEKSTLPPWEVVQRYLAPGGSMVVDDGTGLHYMSFALKRK